MSYKGTGSMAKFADECSMIMEAFNGAMVYLPGDAVGKLELRDGEIVLDLSEAPVFSLANIEYSIPPADTLNEGTARIVSNKLAITLDITHV